MRHTSCFCRSVKVNRLSPLGFVSWLNLFIMIFLVVSGKAVCLSTKSKRSCFCRLGLKPVSKIHMGTMELISSFQQSLRSNAICSLVVVKRSHVQGDTWTTEPIDLYMDSIFLTSNSLRRSSFVEFCSVEADERRPAVDEDEDDEAEDEAAQLDSSSSS